MQAEHVVHDLLTTTCRTMHQTRRTSLKVTSPSRVVRDTADGDRFGPVDSLPSETKALHQARRPRVIQCPFASRAAFYLLGAQPGVDCRSQTPGDYRGLVGPRCMQTPLSLACRSGAERPRVDLVRRGAHHADQGKAQDPSRFSAHAQGDAGCGLSPHHCLGCGVSRAVV